MKKYRFKFLGIEITRKCNYKCSHCMRGKAQNVTITPEIIDKAFSQINQIDRLAILGGETLLELDMLEYLIKTINKNKIMINQIELVTNGSILEAKLIDILTEFVDKDESRIAKLAISDDEFHDLEQSNKALEFYSSLEFDKNKILVHKHSEGIDSIFVKNQDDQDIALKRLAYTGKAIEYADKHLVELRDKNVSVYYPENAFRSHQVYIKNNTVLCQIELAANGNIYFISDLDYVTKDELSFGNILNDSLEAIFTKHNKNCPFLCDECYNEVISKNMMRYDPKESAYDNERQRLMYSLMVIKRCECAWFLRKSIKKLCGALPMKIIIQHTPVVSCWMWERMIEILLSRDIGIERASNVYFKFYKFKFPDATDKQLKNLSLQQYAVRLIDDLPEDKYLQMLFGSNDLQIFKDMTELQTEYLTGQRNLEDDEEETDVCANIADSLYDLTK